jgi:hypothetical protein
MSHIVREGILKMFPNLKILHISFSDSNVFELHEKITNDNYEGKSLRNKLIADNKLTEFDDNINNTGLQMKKMVEEIYGSDVTVKDIFKIIGISVQGLWSMFMIAQNTSTPLLPSTRHEKSGELYHILEKAIIRDCICALNIEEMHLRTCFDTDLSFVVKMPNLKALSISVNSPNFCNNRPTILRGNCYHEKYCVIPYKHDLQKLKISTDTLYSINFDEIGNRFPDLKYLSMNIRGPFDYDTLSYPNQTNHKNQKDKDTNTLESLIKNLQHLETLIITGIYGEYEPNLDARPLKYLCSLHKLRKLDVSNIRVTSDDLACISTIPNLQKLVVKDKDILNWDWVHNTIDSYKDAVESFKLLRPDVKITH